MSTSSASIRDVGRHAIRLNLARVAFEQFCLQGFGRVTFDELAAAAGVSRSTFLRHFRTKEDAVLFVFDPIGRVVASALEDGDSPAGAGRLRAAVLAAAEHVARETPELPELMRLVTATPDLTAGLLAKQALWLEDALPAAVAASPGDEVTVEARVAAAFACLTVALRAWDPATGEPLASTVERALRPLA
jgi:AcrR family transcriptional regulator